MGLKVKVCGYHSWDLGTADEFLSYTPEDPDDFGIGLSFHVCAADDDRNGVYGFFETFICSPKRLERGMKDDEMRLGRHLFIMKRWNPQKVLDHINNFVERIEADTWPELAELISRIARWEDELDPYMDWESY